MKSSRFRRESTNTVPVPPNRPGRAPSAGRVLTARTPDRDRADPRQGGRDSAGSRRRGGSIPRFRVAAAFSRGSRRIATHLSRVSPRRGGGDGGRRDPCPIDPVRCERGRRLGAVEAAAGRRDRPGGRTPASRARAARRPSDRARGDRDRSRCRGRGARGDETRSRRGVCRPRSRCCSRARFTPSRRDTHRRASPRGPVLVPCLPVVWLYLQLIIAVFGSSDGEVFPVVPPCPRRGPPRLSCRRSERDAGASRRRRPLPGPGDALARRRRQSGAGGPDPTRSPPPPPAPPRPAARTARAARRGAARA